MIYSIEDKTKRELIEIVKIQFEEYKKVTAERDAVCLAVFDQRGKPVNEELLNKVRGIVKDVDLLKQAEAL
jgi:hypothetical protein